MSALPFHPSRSVHLLTRILGRTLLDERQAEEGALLEHVAVARDPREGLQEADLLFRQGQIYARFRYWGAPLRDMSAAEVLAFLVPLAESVCGRGT